MPLINAGDTGNSLHSLWGYKSFFLLGLDPETMRIRNDTNGTVSRATGANKKGMGDFPQQASP
jgi:hypothetical protein